MLQFDRYTNPMYPWTQLVRVLDSEMWLYHWHHL